MSLQDSHSAWLPIASSETIRRAISWTCSLSGFEHVDTSIVDTSHFFVMLTWKDPRKLPTWPLLLQIMPSQKLYEPMGWDSIAYLVANSRPLQGALRKLSLSPMSTSQIACPMSGMLLQTALLDKPKRLQDWERRMRSRSAVCSCRSTSSNRTACCSSFPSSRVFSSARACTASGLTVRPIIQHLVCWKPALMTSHRQLLAS